MRAFPAWIGVVAAVLLMALAARAAEQGRPAAPVTDEAQRLYQAHGDAVYQVQVIDVTSGKKTSIGSGFQFTRDGLIATNYHVVAEALQRPRENRVEFLHDRGGTGRLTVVIADVVHDLAIVRMERPGKTWLELGTSRLPKGARLFALGNPHDVGFSIIEGTYNGLSTESFVDQIHFSGSINPGMSGGPVIGHNGTVAGINVATAGNQISFLVPVEPLRRLLDDYLKQPAGYDFPAHANDLIQRQLLASQDDKVQSLLRKKWEGVPFGPVLAPGRVHDALKCWGGANHKDKDPYQYFYSVCSSQNSMFLDSGFDTGTILYRYDYLEAKDTLNLQRFYSLYQSRFSYPLGDFQNAKEDNAGNFACNTHFVDVNALRWKANFCVRPYKKYPALYDLHLNMALVDHGRTGLIATLTAQGVSQKNALALGRKFMDEIRPLPPGAAAQKAKGP